MPFPPLSHAKYGLVRGPSTTAARSPVRLASLRAGADQVRPPSADEEASSPASPSVLVHVGQPCQATKRPPGPVRIAGWPVPSHPLTRATVAAGTPPAEIRTAFTPWPWSFAGLYA